MTKREIRIEKKKEKGELKEKEFRESRTGVFVFLLVTVWLRDVRIRLECRHILNTNKVRIF